MVNGMLFFDGREYILFRIAGFVATGIVNKNKIHTLVFLFQKEVLKKELFEFRQGREGPYSSEIDEYLYNQDCFEVIDEYGKYICCYEYIRLLDSGEEDVVIKIEKGNNNLKVEIKVYYLRDFLAAKSMVLIRFHDHRRFSDIDLTDVGSDTLVDKKIGDTFCYSVTINPNKEILGKCFSRFLGKDILPPFKEPKHKDYMSLKGETQKEYVEFIIGIDEEGDPIEHTCNPDELNSKYLTPVFFKREVLKKYYDNTSKYSVEHNYIRCGYLWSISYGINDCGLVHVWLGDLGRLPYNEQLHWKQYNVPPEGNISESTIRRDLMAEPTEPDDIVDILVFI